MAATSYGGIMSKPTFQRFTVWAAQISLLCLAWFANQKLGITAVAVLAAYCFGTLLRSSERKDSNWVRESLIVLASGGTAVLLSTRLGLSLVFPSFLPLTCAL